MALGHSAMTPTLSSRSSALKGVPPCHKLPTLPQVPFLGSRKRDDKGKLGSYTWMTYAQAGDVRTSIGSGLLQLGLGHKAAVGLYSVNCKGEGACSTGLWLDSGWL